MDLNFNFYELKAAKRLPSPTGVALEIIKLLQSDEASVHQIARLVQSDPALSARVLRFANSAAFGARRPIANVQDAVAMIGMKAIRNFALSLSLIGSSRHGPCRNFDYGGFWARSLLMAVSMAAVTSRERTAIPEEAFSLGLLADIGRLALATAWPDKYSECLLETDEKRLLDIEKKRFAVDHDALTLLLLAEWGMPPVFIDALKLSTHPVPCDEARRKRLAEQIVFSRELSRYCLAGDEERKTMLPLMLQIGQHLYLDESGLSALADEVLGQWYDWGHTIQIKTSIEERPQAQAAPTDAILNVESASEDSAKDHRATATILDVLLVGDDNDFIEPVSKELKAARHQTLVFRNREDALKHILEHPPHLVVIDVEDNHDRLTQDRDPIGPIAFCKALRDYAFGKSIYLIMLSDSSCEDDLVGAFVAGVDDYIVKPVGLRVFMARIKAGQRILALQENLKREHETQKKMSAALALANRKLKHLANTDLLTGMPNRRYAMRRLEKEWISSLRTGRPFSLLMIDLDHFKGINDTLGHDAGDEVLIHFAGILEASIRASDVACRLGGEEFTVIAPDTDCAAALSLAERIRAAVEKNQPPQFELPKLLTASIGVASAVAGKPDWRDLLSMADKAMYQTKHGGRNKVKLASG